MIGFHRDKYCQSGSIKSITADDVNDFRWFGLNYRNAGKDIYTNLRPTPLFDVGNFNSAMAPGFLDVSVGSDKYSTEIDINNNGGALNLSVNDIRNAFALDKLASVTMRAGRTTGKATGSGNGQIKFDAREHGILMCIYSVVPDVQYDSTKIDPFVQKIQRGDFFIPEFEDLGMQPLWCKNISWKYAEGNFTGKEKNSKSPAFGWQPRYSEYKTALDTNHGQFSNGEPLSFWSIGRARANDFLHTFNISSLKINPHWLDSVFAVDYNGTELTDQFFGECYFNILKVSDMTVDGMPRV